MQMKLDELVAALEGASNRLIAVEELSEEELEILGRHFHTLARMAKEHRDIRESHSIEEAKGRHERKYRPRSASRAL